MADSQDLYYTRYGLIDVSPSKGLHDRTRRAMANGGAFLSSANLEDSFADIETIRPAILQFQDATSFPRNAQRSCAIPRGISAWHSSLLILYHDRFHFRDFVNRIDHLAKLASPF